MSRRAAALLAALAAAAAPAAAGAHGGTVIASGSNDAYALTVQAAPVQARGDGPLVDVTAYPVRRSNGALDLRARVEVDLGDGRTVRLRPRGDGLEALVPVEEPGAWRSWAVTARVSGAAGTLEVRGGPLAPPDEGPPRWLWPASGAAAVAAALVVARRRRRPAPPSR